MPTTPLPADQTKVSYILSKADKARLAAAAKKADVSMSALISAALAMAGVLKPKKRATAA